ncbi:MAG: F0F1 ATP synthase subunit B [candidate division KSB1 bacterium]|nr:F0F1 ATP synthase subunit B [candidate division KSB1 bacterium]MDZ7302648.1 F0F1 ATP synthase subunit B [candidate division KSB1 bacterium]MDZ7311513.1 F0F1 ATP synthase subunit B [candidate division KSB1 bacterium]
MLELHTGLIAWTIIIFLLLVVVLRRMAWKPIIGAIEERARRIKDSLEKAEAAQRAAEHARSEYETMIAQARLEAQDLIVRSRKTAEITRDEIVAKAQADAEQLRQRTLKEIDLARQKAVEEIKQTAAQLSIDIAGRIIGKTLAVKDHQELIRQALREMQITGGEPN